MYLKQTENGVVYPYTLDFHFRADHPGVTLPESPSDAQLAEFGVYRVGLQSPPADITQDFAEAAPELVGGVWQQRWVGTPVAMETVAARRSAQRKAMTGEIDAAVEAIYERPMRLAKEYEQREVQAQAYKDAGYTGTVPARVQGFATPAGMTAQAAADLILTQAAQLRGALDALSDLRMRKYEVLRAVDDEAARTAHTQIMASIAAIGAALG